MKKKLLMLSVMALAGISFGAVSLNAGHNFSAVTTKGEVQTYSITLDATNGPTANVYSTTAKTSAGNNFAINYTGTHSVSSGAHTVLGNGASIWNSSAPICHLKSVAVEIGSGALTLTGGQKASALYESYDFTSSGSYTFTDDMNYFRLTAVGSTKVTSVVLTYSADCETGSAATERTISLAGVPSSLEVGKSVNVTPATNSNGALSVVSSDPTVAKVTVSTGKSGTTYKVTALKEGTCKIYAETANGLKTSESTLKVISVGLPSNVVGPTYRCNDLENAYGKTAYITASDSENITLKYDGEEYSFIFDETDANQYRVFYGEDGVSEIDVCPASNGSSLEVFGTVYDESYDVLVEFGNTHTNIGDTFSKYVKATSVSLNKSSTSIDIGATEKLTATVAPTNATNASLVWSSSNEAVATVSYGTIKGVAAGTAVITVKDEDSGVYATCNVTVNGDVPVTSVTVTGNNSVKVGTTTTLTATVAPTNATAKTVTWASSDTTVAKVSSTGVVTGVKVGTANITATVGGVASAPFAITVAADSDPIPAQYQGTHQAEYYEDVYLEVTSDTIHIYSTGDYEGYVDCSFTFVSSSGNKYYFDDDVVMDVSSSYLSVDYSESSVASDFYNVDCYDGYMDFQK